MRQFNILNTRINFTTMKETIELILKNANSSNNGYICIANVHTTVHSYEDTYYNSVQNDSFLTLPDGMPLALIGKRRYGKEVERITGPDLMEEMFSQKKEKNLSHFFYGSTPETLEMLVKNVKKSHPHVNISGFYSPPFRDLTKCEEEEMIIKINNLKPGIVWVGLGAPKQELWMKKYHRSIDSMMIGVGAGFDYHAGNIKRAPLFMQKSSLEWLYRLLQDPKRLWKRYLTTNSKFLYYLVRNNLLRNTKRTK